jgi:hypothetical protein
MNLKVELTEKNRERRNLEETGKETVCGGSGE